MMLENASLLIGGSGLSSLFHLLARTKTNCTPLLPLTLCIGGLGWKGDCWGLVPAEYSDFGPLAQCSSAEEEGVGHGDLGWYYLLQLLPQGLTEQIPILAPIRKD